MPNVPLDNAEAIYQNLRENGFTHDAAVGALGNFHVETGGTLDPNQGQVGGGPGRGIGQWTLNERFKDLTNFAKKRGDDPLDLQTQLAFVHHEIGNDPRFRRMKEKMNKVSADQAALIFSKIFEGPQKGKEHNDRRIAAAKKYSDRFAEQVGENSQYADLVNEEEPPIGKPYEGMSSVPNLKTLEATLKPLITPNSDLNIDPALVNNQNQESTNPFSHLIPIKDASAQNQASNPFGHLVPNKKKEWNPPRSLQEYMLRSGYEGLKDIGQELAGIGDLTMQQGPAAMKYYAQHPLEQPKDIAIGASGILDSLLNIPRNIPANAARVGLIPEEYGEISERLPKFNTQQYIKKFLGREKSTPEQEYLQRLTQDLPMVIPAVKAGARGAAAPLKIANNVFKGADKGMLAETDKLQSDILEHQANMETASEEAAKATADYKEAQARAKQEGLSPDQDRLIGQTKGAGKTLTGLEGEIAEAQKQLADIKPVLPPDEAIDTALQNKEKATAHHEKVQQMTGEHLRENASHAEEMGSALKQEHLAEKESIQTEGKNAAGEDIGYGKLMQNVANKKVEINPKVQVEAKDIIDELHQMWKEDKRHTKDGKALGEQLEKISKKETMSAEDYIDAYKSTRGYLNDANMNSRAKGINQEERVKWEDRAEKLKEQLNKMDGILKKSIGEDDYQLLKRTDNAWRDRVASMYKNPVYRKFMRDELTPDNLINALRGNAKGTNVIKSMVKADPSILKNALGQIYAKSPEKFFDTIKKDVFKEYIDQMPELQSLIKAKEGAQENITTAEKAHTKAQEQNKAFQDFQKQKADLQKNIDQTQKKYADISEQIKKQEGFIQELQKKFKAEQTSLEKKHQAGVRLDQAKAKLKELNKKRDETEGIGRLAIKASLKFAKKHALKAFTGV